MGKRAIYTGIADGVMCEQIDHTGNKKNATFTLKPHDHLLMYHPDYGTFIAKQGMGTWCKQKPEETFKDLQVYSEAVRILKKIQKEIRAGIELREKDLDHVINIMEKGWF